MKPIYIPFFLLLLGVGAAAAYWFFLPEPVAEPDAPVTTEMQYNFLLSELPAPEAGITQDDIAAWEALQDTLTEEELTAFYANYETAYQTLDYGQAFDGQVNEGTNVDLDFIVELMMTDIATITDGQAGAQMYRAPIQTATSVPAYAATLDSHYSPRYLTEVMVRDALAAYVEPQYEADRTDYIDAGLAAGLYYESDVTTAERFVAAYFMEVPADPDFTALMQGLLPEIEVIDVTDGIGIDLDEAELEAIIVEEDAFFNEELESELTQ